MITPSRLTTFLKMISSTVGRASSSLLQNALRQRANGIIVSRNHRLHKSNKFGVIAYSYSTRNSTSLAAVPMIGTQSSDANDFSLKWMKAAVTMAAAGVLVASGEANNSSRDNKTDCCGIVGVVGTKGHDAR